MSRSRRGDLLALALLVLLPSLLFADVLGGFANFCRRDLIRYYYPTKQIYREIVAAGEFPLWNRYFHGGQPLAANPEHEIFYPFTWLLMLPDYDLGYRLHILVHIYIALLTMYALLRSMRLGPPAAFFGAVSFGLGGVFLSYVNLLPILFSAAWLPLTCLFARRFFIDRRPRDFALASLSLGVQCLVGEPTTLLQTGLLLGGYALYRAFREAPPRTRSALRDVGFVGLMSLAAIAAGAVQMVPAIDHVGDSIRSRPMPFEVVSSYSMPWSKLGELVYPNLLGHAGLDAPYWGGGLYDPSGIAFLFSIYPGLAVAALCMAGFVARLRGSGFVAIVAAASILLALGANTPLLRALYASGVATSIRYPEKFVLMAVFALTIFAAHALQQLMAGDERLRRAAMAFALATALIALAVFELSSPARWLAAFGLPADSQTLAMFDMSRRDWAVAVGRGAVLFALLSAITRVPAARWLALGFAFLCIDLGPVVHELNPRLPMSFFTETVDAASELPANRKEYRVFHQAAWHTDREASQRFFSTGPATYWVVRNGLFPPLTAGYGIQTVLDADYDETALLGTRDFNAAMWEVRRAGRQQWWRPFMAMSNAWFRGVYRDFDTEVQRTGGDFGRVAPVEFIEEDRFPRYYFADAMLTAADPFQFVRRIATGPVSDRVAFVEGNAFRPAEGRVVAVKETPNTARIDVVAEGRAFLVMSVTSHKYWRLTLDGRPVRAVAANVAFQGIAVPPGRHTVVMRYHNDAIITGAYISAAAIVMLAAIAIIGRKPRSAIA